MDIIAKAKQVLKIESDGILSIADQLDESFVNFVEMCSETLLKNGKLVLSGIGKSGQIAQKLASTLSSTGSRATFLHPVEALHGDLGMIHKDDLFIALSYSGETDELLATLPAVKRLGNKIVAMTGEKSSTLAQISDLAVITKIQEEACPFNLAPTTTTTAMLALGDALAMVLMEKSKFKIQDYGALHPSGAIGRSVTLKVADVMRKDDRLAIVSPELKVSDAVVAMCQSKGGTVLVGNVDNELLGIFTTGDLKRGISQSEDFLSSPVGNVMVKNPSTVSAEHMAVAILDILSKKSINAIPVVDKSNKIQGVVDIQDLPKFKVL
ncbi:MAG: KpsF/GutQ family sugar-phosphate isomerase [Lentisphaeraceae bacterium]|nr:KpsF/GutQ family sugar-phosphate isomerase [Lentisphaeraceae bacterium]